LKNQHYENKIDKICLNRIDTHYLGLNIFCSF